MEVQMCPPAIHGFIVARTCIDIVCTQPSKPCFNQWKINLATAGRHLVDFQILCITRERNPFFFPTVGGISSVYFGGRWCQGIERTKVSVLVQIVNFEKNKHIILQTYFWQWKPNASEKEIHGLMWLDWCCTATGKFHLSEYCPYVW